VDLLVISLLLVAAAEVEVIAVVMRQVVVELVV
jgi:hypothetical protein